MACSARDTERAPDFQRLLVAETPATLAAETRLATGPTGTVLHTGSYQPGDPLPTHVGLPAALAETGRFLLNVRVWNHPSHVPLPGVRVAQYSRAAAVDATGNGPRAALELDLDGFQQALQLQVIGFPLAGDPTALRQVELKLPSAPMLEFGYGLREESWQGDAERTQFRVELDHEASTTTLLDRWLDPARASDRRWFDERIDLRRWAGQSVALRFSTRRGGEAGGHSLPAWSDPIVYDAEAAEPRPNVIVVSIDTLRSRNLRVYGYDRDTAPFLDSLAAGGAVFEDAITTSVTTAPSHMSLFTGLYPVGHGIRRGNEVKNPAVRTLAESFRAAGYQTAAFTENGYLLRPRGFGDGFGFYTENRQQVDPNRAGGVDPTDARVTFAQARGWIESQQRRPFFAFVHTYEVHTPYRARAPHASRFAGDGLAGPADPEIRAERDNYDREIRVVDDELRALFDTLRALNLEDDTIVVVVADHGEEFHEHGLLQHGGDVYDETLRIPMIFWGPGRIPEGVRIRGPASLIDVVPTLLDLVGLAAPAGVDGLSLRDAMRSGEAPESRRLFAEAFSPRRWVDIWKFEDWNPPLVAVHTARSKAIVHRPSTGARQPTVRFDLVRDPLEREPIAVDGAELAEVERLVDGYLGRATPGVAPQMTPDEENRLRALGYAQ